MDRTPFDFSRFKSQKKERVFSWSSKQDSSTGKDLFVIGAGVLLVVLLFFLYRSITLVEVEEPLSARGPMIVDTWGRPAEKDPPKMSDHSAKRIFQIGLISFAMGLLGFIFSFVILRWLNPKIEGPNKTKKTGQDIPFRTIPKKE